jgi:signal transduction histidine kinase
MRSIKHILETAGGGPILVGLSLPVLILMIIGAVSYRSILEFRASAHSVAVSHELQTKLQNLLTDLVSAESEARGFMIVGKPEYLSLYQTAALETNRDLVEVSGLETSGDVRAGILALQEKITTRLERLKITLDARESAGLDGVVGVAGIGKRLMDEIRSIAQNIETVESSNLQIAGSNFEFIASRTTFSILIGSISAVAFQLISVFALRASFIKRQQLEVALLEISEREQHRIGQDLHDGICQQLTGVSLMVKSIQAGIPADIPSALSPIVALINGCIEETRMVIRGLHPVSDDLGGLQVGLKELADSLTNATGIHCEIQIKGEVPTMPLETSTNIYRIVQESIRNAVKHSQCKTIQIVVHSSSSRLEIFIVDDGIGLGTRRRSGGFGLGIMGYRSSSIGAKLQITENKPSGTRVYLLLNLEPDSAKS